jgi:hypothetical protein
MYPKYYNRDPIGLFGSAFDTDYIESDDDSDRMPIEASDDDSDRMDIF